MTYDAGTAGRGIELTENVGGTGEEEEEEGRKGVMGWEEGGKKETERGTKG